MSAERDETRIVRSWLEEGVTVLPDRVLDAVLDQVPATPQRRAGGWRGGSPHEQRYTNRVVAAAAVVIRIPGSDSWRLPETTSAAPSRRFADSESLARWRAPLAGHYPVSFPGRRCRAALEPALTLTVGSVS